MKYLPDPDASKELSPAEVRDHFDAYRAYLVSVQSRMPADAFEFATAEWHYDATRHECPHDSWVESLKVHEIGSGTRSEIRRLEIQISLLGAYHDGWLRLRYEDVKAYSLSLASERLQRRTDTGHGDWVIDEVTLSPQGTVLHEIAFSSGARYLIDSSNLVAAWRVRDS